MDLRSVLIEIHEALRAEAIAHALIGGLALAAHGVTRATVDLDLLAESERADDVDRIALHEILGQQMRVVDGSDLIERAPDINTFLDWLDALQGAFGDSPVNRQPWRGDDFRL